MDKNSQEFIMISMGKISLKHSCRLFEELEKAKVLGVTYYPHSIVFKTNIYTIIWKYNEAIFKHPNKKTLVRGAYNPDYLKYVNLFDKWRKKDEN